LVKEALEKRMRKEDFEKALGRTIRNHKMDFSVYIKIISELRELARSSEISAEDAARILLRERDEKA